MDTIKEVDCLLINPPDDFSQYPYLGLCSLAGVLQAQNIAVAILDSAAMGYTVDAVIDHIKRRKAKIIGISVMSMMLKICYELIKEIKKHCPETTIVVGGAHLDADPEILIPMELKYGFQGECEFEFAQFCREILEGKKPSPAPGLIINERGRITLTAPRIMEDLDIFPIPAYNLIPHEKYFSPSTSIKTISVITSRGCPFNCAFCSKLQQKKYRSLSISRIVEIVKYLVNDLGFEWIEFVDEIFTINKKRVLLLCQALQAEKLQFQWGIGTRADCIDEELIKIMKKTGCRKIGFGIESGVERVRFAINKKITNQQIEDAVSICKKHGLKIQAGFIFGHPTETLAEMRETISYVRKLGLNFPNFNKMMLIPNSEIFHNAIANNEVSRNIWEEYMLSRCPYPIYTPQGVSPEQVSRIFKRAWYACYLHPANIWRNRDLLINPKSALKGIVAFLNSATEKRYK